MCIYENVDLPKVLWKSHFKAALTKPFASVSYYLTNTKNGCGNNLYCISYSYKKPGKVLYFTSFVKVCY